MTTADSATAELLHFLSPEQAERLAALGRVREWEIDQVVMAPEQPAEFLAFVLSGKLAVKKPSSFPGRFILLAEIERGGLVGEAVVIGDHGGEYATVVAREPSRLLELPGDELQKLLAEDHELARRLMARVIRVMRRRLSGAGQRLSWIL